MVSAGSCSRLPERREGKEFFFFFKASPCSSRVGRQVVSGLCLSPEDTGKVKLGVTEELIQAGAGRVPLQVMELSGGYKNEEQANEPKLTEVGGQSGSLCVSPTSEGPPSSQKRK